MFSRSRGLVVGLLTASSATGQLVVMPLLAGLVEAHGWRSAILLLVGLLSIAGLVVALVMRDRPEDVGLSAYGEPPGTPSPPPPSTDAIGTLRIAAPAMMKPKVWIG